MFRDNGKVVPVTVIDTTLGLLLILKPHERDGYSCDTSRFTYETISKASFF